MPPYAQAKRRAGPLRPALLIHRNMPAAHSRIMKASNALDLPRTLLATFRFHGHALCLRHIILNAQPYVPS